jgi:Fe-S cluster assembly protein SufD
MKDHFKSVEDLFSEDDPFIEMRKLALDKAQAMRTSQEKGSFPIHEILAREWGAAAPLEFASTQVDSLIKRRENEPCIVLIDGHFSKDYSTLSGLPEEIVVITLKQAHCQFKSFVQRRFQSILKDERDPFSLLNMAFHGEGVFLYVPPHVIVEGPIKILHVITQENSRLSPRLHIYLGAHAELSLRMTTQTSALRFWNNAAIDLSLEQGAKLQTLFTTPSSMKGWHLTHVRASLKQEAYFEATALNYATGKVREAFDIALMESEAHVVLKGLSCLKDNSIAHTVVSLDHAAPKTISSQHFKAVMDDCAQHHCYGQVLIRQSGAKSQAQQKCQHLLLGKRSRGVASPRLRIHNHDVQAAHGATLSQLEDDALFYLQSRGLSHKEASEILVEGFCREILDQISNLEGASYE